MPHQIIWSWYTGRWWVSCYIWYSEEGTGRGPSPPRPILAVPNVTAYPSTANVPITVLLYNGPLLWGFNVSIKGLRCANFTWDRIWRSLMAMAIMGLRECVNMLNRDESFNDDCWHSLIDQVLVGQLDLCDLWARGQLDPPPACMDLYVWALTTSVVWSHSQRSARRRRVLSSSDRSTTHALHVRYQWV